MVSSSVSRHDSKLTAALTGNHDPPLLSFEFRLKRLHHVQWSSFLLDPKMTAMHFLFLPVDLNVEDQRRVSDIT